MKFSSALFCVVTITADRFDDFINTLLDEHSHQQTSSDFMLNYLEHEKDHDGHNNTLFNTYLGYLEEQKRINALFDFFESVSFILNLTVKALMTDFNKEANALAKKLV